MNRAVDSVIVEKFFWQEQVETKVSILRPSVKFDKGSEVREISENRGVILDIQYLFKMKLDGHMSKIVSQQEQERAFSDLELYFR